LISGRTVKGASRNVRYYTDEIIGSENVGVDIGIMSVSRPVPELQGQLCTPPAVYITKFAPPSEGEAMLKTTLIDSLPSPNNKKKRKICMKCNKFAVI
jgi:hypothetical protein